MLSVTLTPLAVVNTTDIAYVCVIFQTFFSQQQYNVDSDTFKARVGTADALCVVDEREVKVITASYIKLGGIISLRYPLFSGTVRIGAAVAGACNPGLIKSQLHVQYTTVSTINTRCGYHHLVIR